MSARRFPRLRCGLALRCGAFRVRLGGDHFRHQVGIVRRPSALWRVIEDRLPEAGRFRELDVPADAAVEDPRGPIKLDDLGNPTQNVYILKVEKVGGKLTNTVVHTYPMVSQFWTYKADEFLKLPAYSRDYPPARP